MVFDALPDKLSWAAFTSMAGLVYAFIMVDVVVPRPLLGIKNVKWWYSEISKWKYLEDKNPWKFALVGFEGSVGLGLLEYDPEELATTVKGIYVWGKGIDHFW